MDISNVISLEKFLRNIKSAVINLAAQQSKIFYRRTIKYFDSNIKGFLILFTYQKIWSKKIHIC